MEVLVFAVLLGLIPAAIASKKGRSFSTWWFFGALLFIVALPMALMMKSEDEAATSGSKRRTKASPDNHVPGWLVLVVFCGIGVWIYSQVDSSGNLGSTSPSYNSPSVATVSEGLSGPRGNAVRSAKQYLSVQGFSRNGLIEQLSSDYGDGYNRADATAAVDSLNMDWSKQAARSAQQYLSIQGFSCKGLIEQLSSGAGDKYTIEQATYGARQAGAC
ncbi:Ltp family lipoprotein [Marinobacter sp. LV10MA510-1]|uniref:Ltp family lipoprotein n=1 Tax=Marinobacter sp. LV10MA510-1 TaxID=1415567 RepID=UPI000C016657|nr:Ltp family lipoprotein [Marinobacter sp. LV10MA510-1]PFG10696.1 host cell surface-exposed lipoprotein [Marinobacter sp. LV10MA510-1]